MRGVAFRATRRSDSVGSHIQESAKVPARDNPSDKLTFCQEHATVEPANLAPAELCFSIFRPRMAPVEGRWPGTRDKGIQGEVSHVQFRDPEQLQGAGVGSNETPVTIRDRDWVGGARHPIVQIALTRGAGLRYPLSLEGDAARRGGDGARRRVKFRRRRG